MSIKTSIMILLFCLLAAFIAAWYLADKMPGNPNMRKAQFEQKQLSEEELKKNKMEADWERAVKDLQEREARLTPEDRKRMEADWEQAVKDLQEREAKMTPEDREKMEADWKKMMETFEKNQ